MDYYYCGLNNYNNYMVFWYTDSSEYYGTDAYYIEGNFRNGNYNTNTGEYSLTFVNYIRGTVEKYTGSLENIANHLRLANEGFKYTPALEKVIKEYIIPTTELIPVKL